MSRGLGKVQRAVIDVIAGKPVKHGKTGEVVKTLYKSPGELTTREVADELLNAGYIADAAIEDAHYAARRVNRILNSMLARGTLKRSQERVEHTRAKVWSWRLTDETGAVKTTKGDLE